VLKSDSRVKEVYMSNRPGNVVSLARLSTGQHDRPSFPFIYNVHQPRLFLRRNVYQNRIYQSERAWQRRSDRSPLLSRCWALIDLLYAAGGGVRRTSGSQSFRCSLYLIAHVPSLLRQIVRDLRYGLVAWEIQVPPCV
jgi:hypothetical protein